MSSDALKTRRAYYLKNRERILEKSKAYYKQRKAVDPDYYQRILKRNEAYYYRGGRTLIPLTEEEEEAFFQKIKRDVIASYDSPLSSHNKDYYFQ